MNTGCYSLPHPAFTGCTAFNRARRLHIVRRDSGIPDHALGPTCGNDVRPRAKEGRAEEGRTKGDKPMGALLHRRIARPRSSGPRRSNAGRYCDEARLTLLLATLCAAPACALAEEPDPGLELGVDSFGVELTRAHAPNAMDSSIPALRAAAIFQGESGIAFKQTLIYGSGKSIQGRAWQADTRLGPMLPKRPCFL